MAPWPLGYYYNHTSCKLQGCPLHTVHSGYGGKAGIAKSNLRLLLLRGQWGDHSMTESVQALLLT